MVLINFTPTYAALRAYIDDYNRDKEYPDKVRGNIITTINQIIKIYSQFIKKASKVESIDPGNLPPLRTNNQQLAKLTHYSSRTIQRHILKLLDAGIIVQKVWHGTNSSYELWINPCILLTRGGKAQISDGKRTNSQNSNNTDNQSFKKLLTSNCPYTENSNIKNNIIREVENVNDEASFQELLKNNFFKGYTRKDVQEIFDGQNSTLPVSETESKKINRRVAGAKTQNFEKETREDVKRRAERSNVVDPARQSSIEMYVWILWRTAKNTIYKDKFLTAWQEKIGQELLYDWFEIIPTRKLSYIHQVYTERIHLLQRWVSRDKSRYVLLPNKLFDIENPKGFRKTKGWYLKQQKRNKKIRISKIVHDQIQKFYKAKFQPGTIPKSPLEVFRECETRISKLNNRPALDKFYAAVLDPDKFNNSKHKVIC